MNGKNILLFALLLAAFPLAHAADANQPVSQGEASVDKNLAKNPNNKGLQNADQTLERNQARIAAKRAAAARKRQAAKHREEMRENRNAQRHEREGMDRPMMERPERPPHPGR